MSRLTTFLIAAAALTSAPVAAAPLYSNDFDGNVTVGSGVVVTPLTNGVTETATTGAWNGNGWSGNIFVNRSTGNPAASSVLTLSNLAPHSTVSIAFLLGFMESWDSSDGGCCSPDFLRVIVDGNPILVDLTTNNTLGSVEAYGGGTELFDSVQLNNENFGFSDTLVDMSTAGALTFAHSGSTLTLEIQAYGAGWQGGGDEAWAIDKLALTYDARARGVPEPAAWAMMIAGFGLAGAAARRRRTAIAYA